MANRGEVPNHPVQVVQHIIIGQLADVPGHRYHLHLLDAARALILLGAVAAISAVGNGNPDDDANGDAAQVLLGFITWLLGVGLLWLVPVAGWFPQADAFAGAAIGNASAALGYLLAPWN